jgi:hypothetical protein
MGLKNRQFLVSKLVFDIRFTAPELPEKTFESKVIAAMFCQKRKVGFTRLVP